MAHPLIICDYQAIIVREDTDALFDVLEQFSRNGAEIYFGTYAKGDEHDGQRHYMEHHYPGFIDAVLGKNGQRGFITPAVVGTYKHADSFWPALCDRFAINARHVVFMDNDPLAMNDAKKLGVRTIDTGSDHTALEHAITELKTQYAILTPPRDSAGTTGTADDVKKCRGRRSLDILIGKIGPKPN